MKFIPLHAVLIGGLCWMQPLARGSLDPVKIHVDAAAAGVPVNQKVFGQFIKGADNHGVFSIPYPDLAAIREGDGIWNSETRAPFPDAWKILQSYRPGALRYPDGLPIHNHDWKKTIGPVGVRGDRTFGLNEFMQLSEALKTEPIFVVSEYIGTPQDAADLVEYLNMPATPGHPWAQRRAADGHPQPYHVRYFEVGNESWVDWRKIGKPEVRTPGEVGRYASTVAAAMKRVDPRIRCGIPLERKDNDQWNHGVLKAITADIDFAIIHIYPVKYGGGDMEGLKENLLLEAMMGAGYTTGFDLVRIREEIRGVTGRDLPMAITEYNLGPTQQTPGLERPYRFTLAAALGAGDYLGRLLDPQLGVESAVYWSWLNGAFETVRTYAGHPWKTREKLAMPEVRPAHYIFQLWARYRGEYLLPLRVDAPRLEFPGITTMKPTIGTVARPAERITDDNILDGARLLKPAHDHTTISRADDGEWMIRYDGLTGGAYPNLLIRGLRDLPAAVRPPAPGLLYKVSFEALWQPDDESSAPNLGVGIMDARGWKKSGSAIAIRGLQAARDWTEFKDTYQPLPDTEAIVVLARVESGTVPLRGTLRIRGLRATPWRSETYPARPALSAYATRSEDGNKLHLLVFNLTLDRDLPAVLSWDGFAATEATYSELNGTSAAAVNRGAATVGWRAENVPLPLRSPSGIEHVFPAHSATGITLERATPVPVGDPGEYKSQLDAPAATPDRADPAAFRILCIGDSITRHGTSDAIRERLGWDHVAGMAASSEENDYAHRLARLVRATMPDRPVELYFHTSGGSGSAGQRLSTIEEARSISPHLIVIQLGEHEKEAAGVQALTVAYDALVTAFDRQSPRPQIIATGVWSLSRQEPDGAGGWRYAGWAAAVERTMQDVCEKRGVLYVSVSDLARDPTCRGWGAAPGVKWHPNDKGHEGYANKIFEAWRRTLRQ